MEKVKKSSFGDFGDFGFFPISYLEPTVHSGLYEAKNGNSDFLTQTKLMEMALNVQKQHFM